MIFRPLLNRLQRYIRTGQSNSRFITWSHRNFSIMSPLSRQESFPLQVKRICGDSSFVTLMSFSAKLNFLASQIFLSLFWIPRQNSQLLYFCNRLRTAKRYVTWLVSNHDRRITSENPGVYILTNWLLITLNGDGKVALLKMMDWN